MLSTVWSSALHGVNALPIEVETHIEPNLPRYTVVGLPDSAVRESRDRVLAALKNSGLPAPRGAITINLAPADVRKEGAAFDLPIALGLLSAGGNEAIQARLDSLFIAGELSLDGSVRPVRGILPLAMRAKDDGKEGVLVPEGNAPEAAVVGELNVYPVKNLAQAWQFLRGQIDIEPFQNDLEALFKEARKYDIDFEDVRGQENVKRGLEVAAAGGHNVLMVGPPGSGKTMLAKRMPSVLPPLSTDEALETTRIHSVGGKLNSRHGLVATRPFRSPHHTISDAGLCGGGTNPLPGEISLAHNGVLFLDELPEFKRQVLEVMRQPLEDGQITISRARVTVDFPAQFMLIASMNPCPCGYLNDPVRSCVCSPVQIQRYLGRVSGPLLDRIDLHIEVTPVSFDALNNRKHSAESSIDIRSRVVEARNIQITRFAEHKSVHNNALMGSRLVRKHCQLDVAGRQLIKTAIHRLGLSARAYDRILKVARTIADLAAEENIKSNHLAEAIQYRSLDRDWWNG